MNTPRELATTCFRAQRLARTVTATFSRGFMGPLTIALGGPWADFANYANDCS